jgi:hypothetical protein
MTVLDILESYLGDPHRRLISSKCGRLSVRRESGSSRLSDSSHSLRLSTIGQGFLGKSPDPTLQPGSVMWQVDGGEGQFARVSGIYYLELYTERDGRGDRQSLRPDFRAMTTVLVLHESRPRMSCSRKSMHFDCQIIVMNREALLFLPG